MIRLKQTWRPSFGFLGISKDTPVKNAKKKPLVEKHDGLVYDKVLRCYVPVGGFENAKVKVPA